ncbi:hypothetical protein MCC93_20190 [Morococcus cerebrosus]|uniref:Uncharacterized protein n=1 Tax=Morococcus cerebrosus TaxID=1056807 RepID=A0A0C1GJ40_9NEIS|nr:hypothetical protein MCC93_20190 [Morococcus cerebrosus]
MSPKLSMTLQKIQQTGKACVFIKDSRSSEIRFRRPFQN